METNKTNIEFLIIGFLTNSLNKNELEELWEWLNEDEGHRKEFESLRSAWIVAGLENGKPGFDAGNGKQSFDAGTGWPAVEQRIKLKKRRRLNRFRPLWHAASLLIGFVSGALVFLFASQNEQVQTEILAAATTTATTTTIVNVPLGSKSCVTLPDGSLVWLNAGSEIRYFSDFGQENRNLQLTGEGFFDVKSDSMKPFNVHTSGMIVKAYGTRFNVKAYPDDLTLAATLEEGKIDVEIQTSSDGKVSPQSVKLRPKEQLVIHKSSKETKIVTPTTTQKQEKVQAAALAKTAISEVVIKPNVKTELSTSWKDSKWIISEEPLALFAANLERRYNIHIRFASEELKRYNFSGIFENETIEQILTALSLAAPVNYKFDKNHVVLSLNQKDEGKFSKVLKNK